MSKYNNYFIYNINNIKTKYIAVIGGVTALQNINVVGDQPVALRNI